MRDGSIYYNELYLCAYHNRPMDHEAHETLEKEHKTFLALKKEMSAQYTKSVKEPRHIPEIYRTYTTHIPVTYRKRAEKNLYW